MIVRRWFVRNLHHVELRSSCSLPGKSLLRLHNTDRISWPGRRHLCQSRDSDLEHRSVLAGYLNTCVLAVRNCMFLKAAMQITRPVWAGWEDHFCAVLSVYTFRGCAEKCCCLFFFFLPLSNLQKNLEDFFTIWWFRNQAVTIYFAPSATLILIRSTLSEETAGVRSERIISVCFSFVAISLDILCWIMHLKMFHNQIKERHLL